MKLKDLKSVLNVQKVNLYIEARKPIKFEIWRNEEYMRLGSVDGGDTMYKEFGEYRIEQIYSQDYETINIDLDNI